MKNKFYKFLCLIIVFTVICSFLIIPTFASEDLEVSEDPSTMIIKAGTYRFNDELNALPYDVLKWGFNAVEIRENFLSSYGIDIVPLTFEGVTVSRVSIGNTFGDVFVDGVPTVFYDAIVFYSGNFNSVPLSYVAGIEFTVPKDTEANEITFNWFTENTQKVISTVKTGTYQFNESFGCIEYDVYSLVQSSYIDVYWLLENHGISPSNLYYFIDDIPYLVERISLANTFAYSLVDGVPSKFNQCFAIQYRKDSSPICTTVSLDEFAGQTFYISSDQDVSYDYLSWFSSSVSQVTGVGPGEEGDVVDLSNITAEELYNLLIESYPDLANDLFAYATENWLDEKLLSSYNPDLFSAILKTGSDAARDFFYDEGYDDGFDVGFSEGSSEGYDSGHHDGYSEGYDVGLVQGHNLSVSETFGNNLLIDVFSSPIDGLNSIILHSDGVITISLWNVIQTIIMVCLIFWVLKLF